MNTTTTTTIATDSVFKAAVEAAARGMLLPEIAQLVLLVKQLDDAIVARNEYLDGLVEELERVRDNLDEIVKESR